MTSFKEWTHSAWFKPRGRSITILLLLALVTALEFGLRLNHQSQFQTIGLEKPAQDKMVIVSLGDSVSAGYPSILESILNPPGRTKFVVQNQYKTVFKRGTLQRTIESLTVDSKPDVVLLMLGQFGSQGLQSHGLPKSLNWTEDSIVSKVIGIKLFSWVNHMKKIAHWFTFLDTDVARKQLNLLHSDLSRGLYLTEFSQSKIETTKTLLEALESSFSKDLTFLTSKYYLSLISQEKDNARDRLNTIRSIWGDNPPTKELDAFFQLEFNSSATSGFSILSDLLKSGHISALGCLVFHSRKLDAGQIGDGIKALEVCRNLHPTDGWILFKLLEARRLNGQAAEALLLASTLESFDWPEERISRLLLKQYYYLALEISKDNRPHSYELANETMRKALNHSEKLIRADKADESAIHTFFWSQRFLTGRGNTSLVDSSVVAKVEELSQFGAYAAIFEKTQGNETARAKQEFANKTFTQGELISDESEQTLDLPFGLLKALNSLCDSGVTVALMQYPNQSLKPLQRATRSLGCVRFIDSRETLRESVRQNSHSLNELFQDDGLHLTELGNQLLARRVCTFLHDDVSGPFASIDCQRPL